MNKLTYLITLKFIYNIPAGPLTGTEALRGRINQLDAEPINQQDSASRQQNETRELLTDF